MYRAEDGSKLVTDKRFYMDGFLKSNLDEVPRFLKNSWDCVIIVSGHSKVRIGKSTLAAQIAYYLAWLMAGGEKMKPDTKIKFSMKNICFTAEELMEKSEKSPRNSVFVYDEAMTGLNSSRAMENINKSMLDFFTECGQFGHIIVIVLPSFFRLSEDIALPRSLFLIDVYTDEKYNRGRFAFYNEQRKEALYSFGKKKIGTFQKYNATHPNFRGKFTKFFPLDEEKYNERKKDAINKKKLTKFQRKVLKQRNILMYILNREYKMTEEQIAEKLTLFSGIKLTREAVTMGITSLLGENQYKTIDESDEEVSVINEE